MKKNKLSRIANTLVVVAVVFALFMIVATIALNDDGVYLESFTGIIIAFSVLGFALAIILVIGLQEIEEKRTLVLKSEDIKPGTTMRVIGRSRSEKYILFKEGCILQVMDRKGEGYLLELEKPLPEHEGDWYIKAETGDIVPHIGEVELEKEQG